MGTRLNRLAEAVLTSCIRLNRLAEAVLTSTHNLRFKQKLEKISEFLSDFFFFFFFFFFLQFLEVKFSVCACFRFGTYAVEKTGGIDDNRLIRSVHQKTFRIIAYPQGAL